MVFVKFKVTGSFVRHAGFLVDPAWEFAIGWNLVYGNLLSIPSEITAICVLFQFWTDINSAVWIIVFMILTVIVGVAFVRCKYPVVPSNFDLFSSRRSEANRAQYLAKSNMFLPSSKFFWWYS